MGINFERIEFTINGLDKVPIYCYRWCNPENKKPDAIVQIAHGMAEHALRYEPLANFLVSKNIEVWANDHRGHGKTAASPEKCGYFSDKDGWLKVVDDLKIINDKIKDTHKNSKIILFGHSMGSFLAQTFIQRYPDSVSYVILSGTSGDPGILGSLGIIITEIFKFFGASKRRNYIMDKLSFGKYNNAFKPNKTKFDWLSRDELEVKKYIDDPYCGFVCTTLFFNDLLKGIKSNFKDCNLKKINKDIKIYIFSGEKDPVGENTKSVLNLIKIYQKYGIKNIEYKFYKDGRHEMINEINKSEVYEDIYKWIKSIL
ncbi:MAG: lysophospholipase [Spirochaetes bacterium]|nr:lysophospholipase [Spirochaetota bacterium]